MVGIALEYTTTGLADVQRRLRALETADRAELADSIGVRLEGSAQERIATTKTAPDGTPWAEWSAGYRPGRQGASMLFGGGSKKGEVGLYDGVSSRATADAVVQGASIEYAAIHQLGGDTSQGHPAIPARPYLGVSAEDERFIDDLATDWLREALV